jgi:diguanylate cyclase (GGDEF)-like protein
MAICIIDIDNFKKVNDVYGHLYGDKVLARIGKKLKEVVGDGGIIGRIGGDEFIVAFFDIMDENYLRGILRSIRTQIKWEFVNDFADFNITCSIGASQYPKNGTNYDELFKKADYCLYIAKEKGRDRYVFFRENLHSVGFEESQNRKDKKQNIGREMLELKYINHILSIFTDNKRKAIEELFMHIKNTFKVDSINVFVGDNLERKITVGKILDNSDNALYVKEESFKKLLKDKDYMEVSFIGKITGISPKFEKAMKAKDVISTIHVLFVYVHYLPLSSCYAL